MAFTARYFRWTIRRRRGGGLTVPLAASLFEVTHEGSRLAWPNGTTARNPGGSFDPLKGPQNLIDGRLSTIWEDDNFNEEASQFIGGSGRSVIVIESPSPIRFDGYQWGTANDPNNRDPIDWVLEISNDGQTWTDIHAITEFPPLQRNTRTRIYLEPLRIPEPDEAEIIDDVQPPPPEDPIPPSPISERDGASVVDLRNLVRFSRTQFNQTYQKGTGKQLPVDEFTVTNLSDDIEILVSIDSSTGIRITPSAFTLFPREERTISANYNVSSLEQLPAGISTVTLDVNLTSNTIIEVPPTTTTSTTTTLPPPTLPPHQGCPDAGMVIDRIQIFIDDFETGGSRIAWEETYLADNPDPFGDPCIQLIRTIFEDPPETTTTQPPETGARPCDRVGEVISTIEEAGDEPGTTIITERYLVNNPDTSVGGCVERTRTRTVTEEPPIDDVPFGEDLEGPDGDDDVQDEGESGFADDETEIRDDLGGEVI